jgi:predicted DNA-binding antitoxin AbrB/MazE fold protein
MKREVDAVYDRGVFRPLKPLLLPEGTRVRLHIEPETSSKSTQSAVPGVIEPTDSTADKSLADRYRNIIGAARNLPEDMAENHDHYLHGRPKK